MIHSKEKDVLRQIQELFCLREFTVSLSWIYTTNSQEALFLDSVKSHLTR